MILKLEDELRNSIESNCSISVGNCWYSTDRPLPDTVNISLANTNIGFFKTTSQKRQWNVIYTTYMTLKW